MSVETVSTKGWVAPSIETPSKVESILLERIEQLTQLLSKEEEKKATLKLEKERFAKCASTNSKLLEIIISSSKQVLGESFAMVTEQLKKDQSEENLQLQKALQNSLQKISNAEASLIKLDQMTKEGAERAKFVNSVDAEYMEIEKQKEILLKLYTVNLKQSSTNTIKDITEKLHSWTEYFNGIRSKLEGSKATLCKHIRELRNFIDYLELNPISPNNNPCIAQYLAMLDEDMIARLQFDVCNIQETVKINTMKVEVQNAINANVVKELKVRHDKFLKQYIEIESLLQKIELRLSKFTHHMNAHPSLFQLKEESTHFQSRLAELQKLMETSQSSLFSLVKRVLGFLTEYNGKNPLKDEQFSDEKFKEKIHTIESGWSKKGLKFEDDSEYCSFKNGTVQLPEKGLFTRAQEMKSTVELAEAKLKKYLKDYETNKIMDQIFNKMKFYAAAEQDKIRKMESSDFITELSEINDLLVDFGAGWKQTEGLFAKTMPDTLNFVCSSVMTNDGIDRSVIWYPLKGFVVGNTQYVLAPFK